MGPHHQRGSWSLGVCGQLTSLSCPVGSRSCAGLFSLLAMVAAVQDDPTQEHTCQLALLLLNVVLANRGWLQTPTHRTLTTSLTLTTTPHSPPPLTLTSTLTPTSTHHFSPPLLSPVHRLFLPSACSQRALELMDSHTWLVRHTHTRAHTHTMQGWSAPHRLLLASGGWCGREGGPLHHRPQLSVGCVPGGEHHVGQHCSALSGAVGETGV